MRIDVKAKPSYQVFWKLQEEERLMEGESGEKGTIRKILKWPKSKF